MIIYLKTNFPFIFKFLKKLYTSNQFYKKRIKARELAIKKFDEIKKRKRKQNNTGYF